MVRELLSAGRLFARVRWQGCLLVLFLTISDSATHLTAGEFFKRSGLVGDANCFGEFEFTSHLGVIELSRSERYDFYYVYSSEPTRHSPHLGRGFFVPMLEAVLIDRDYFLEATTMGGNTIYLYRLPAEPDRYVSLNGKNSVQKLGEGIFRRTTADGFEFHYRLGRLQRMITPKKTELTFRYDGEFCEEIRSSTGGLVCAFKRKGEREFVFSSASGNYGLELKEYPADPEEDALGLEVLSLGRIGWPDGKQTLFDYSRSDEEDLRLLMSYEDDQMLAEWRRFDGRVLRVDGVRYEVSPLSREIDYEAERTETGTYSIRRVYEDDSWDLFFHDEDAGYSETTGSDGSASRTHFINTRGPVFNLVRKRERRIPGEAGDSWEVVYEAFYDSRGGLLREVEGDVVTWHLRTDGLPGSVVGPADNYLRYDERQRVVESRVGKNLRSIRWMHDGTRRVLSQFEWGELHLAWFDPYGNSIPMPPNETFPERKKW